MSAGGNAAAQVADAASYLPAMRWALLLDAPVLLLVPAVLFVGAVAGARQSRTAAVGNRPRLVIGFVLLAIALWRTRAVPRWAAVAVGAFPIVGLVFSPAGAALAVAGFGACALTLWRGAGEP